MKLLTKIVDILNYDIDKEINEQLQKREVTQDDLEKMAHRRGYCSYAVMKHEEKCQDKFFKHHIRKALNDIKKVNWDELND